MRKYVLLFVLLYLAGCAGKKQPREQLVVPETAVVFVDEDSLCPLKDFIPIREYTMLCFVNTDCSVCLVGISLWLKFAEEHPEVTPVIVTPASGSKKVFWTQMLTYFKSPLYVIFDTERELFQMNRLDEQTSTLISDASGTIILKGNIHDKKFSEQYRRGVPRLAK